MKQHVTSCRVEITSPPCTGHAELGAAEASINSALENLRSQGFAVRITGEFAIKTAPKPKGDADAPAGGDA